MSIRNPCGPCGAARRALRWHVTLRSWRWWRSPASYAVVACRCARYRRRSRSVATSRPTEAVCRVRRADDADEAVTIVAPSPRLSGSNHPAGAIVHVGTVPSVCGLCSAPWDVPGQGGHDGPSPYVPLFFVAGTSANVYHLNATRAAAQQGQQHCPKRAMVVIKLVRSLSDTSWLRRWLGVG